MLKIGAKIAGERKKAVQAPRYIAKNTKPDWFMKLKEPKNAHTLANTPNDKTYTERC